MRLLSFLATLTLLSACAVPGSGEYRLAKTIPIKGDGGWDYVTVDENVRHVYVSHSTQVEVLNADSGKSIGRIANLHGVHGIAIAPDLERGFITNGKSDEVTVFDKDGVIKNIKVGHKPDAITYDTLTHRVFVMNGESASATVIDAQRLKKIGTIALKGSPEFAVTDGIGHVFVNIEDKNQLATIDSKTLKVIARYDTAPGEKPSSLAIDKDNQRLFIGCRNSLLVIMNASDGEIIDSLPIGEIVDATAFDPGTRKVISSNGDGTMTVVNWESANVYRVAETVQTPKGSKTFGLDTKTHTLFVPAAEFAPPKPPETRPAPVPGTFKVLMFEQQ